MGKYGKTAILATALVSNGKNNDPVDAWKQAAAQVFSNSQSSREKSCPMSTFLGLCENDLVAGIPSGKYTRSVDNKRYALQAIEQLRKNPSLADNEEKLWKLVIGQESKIENSQMDVVTSLWREGLINSDA